MMIIKEEGDGNDRHFSLKLCVRCTLQGLDWISYLPAWSGHRA